jgi:hypothetical protein
MIIGMTAVYPQARVYRLIRLLPFREAGGKDHLHPPDAESIRIRPFLADTDTFNLAPRLMHAQRKPRSPVIGRSRHPSGRETGR